MKQKILYLIAAFVISLFVISVISAVNMNNQQICKVSYKSRNANSINNQIPHFECCVGDWCSKGDTLNKHIRLYPQGDTDASNVDAEADLHAYSYNGMDSVRVNLRVSRLMPVNEKFTAWLIDSSNNEKIRLGMLRTNKMGRGVINFQEKVDDFNDYDKLVVTNSDNEQVLSGNLDFKTTTN